jgi:hypothetical protein
MHNTQLAGAAHLAETNPEIRIRRARSACWVGEERTRGASAPATVLKYEVDLTFPGQAVSDQAVAFQSGSLDAVKGGFDSPDGVGPQFLSFFEPMAGSYVEV